MSDMPEADFDWAGGFEARCPSCGVEHELVRPGKTQARCLCHEHEVTIAERDATIRDLQAKIQDLEIALSDYEPGSGEFERVRAIGYGNESARLATEASGEPSEWDIYTKQMVEIAEYADWEIRDYRRDLEKVRRYAESGVHHAVIQAAATNALSPVRRNFLPPPPVPDEGK